MLELKSILVALALNGRFLHSHPTVGLILFGIFLFLVLVGCVRVGMYWRALHHHKRGLLLLKTGHLDGAIVCFNRSLKLHDYAISYYDRGLAKQANGDADGATADFHKAIELQPRLAQREASEGGALSSGFSIFQDFPLEVQRKLLSRQKGQEPNQYILPLFSPRLTILSGCFLIMFYYMCIYDVVNRTMATPDLFESAVALCFPTLIFYLLLSRFFKSIASPIKRFICVTPRYLIRANYREIWYWPVQDILNIRFNSLVGPFLGYTLTHLTIETNSGDVRETTLLHNTDPNELLVRLPAFQTADAGRMDSAAIATNDNDFASVVASPFYKTKLPTAYRIASVAIPIVTGLLFYLYAWYTVAYPS
jgi:tetratricopeptide (TPR) repeat protein